MSSEQAFADKVKSELRVRPILPFGAPLELGSIGVVDDNRFGPRGTVRSVLHMGVGRSTPGSKADWHVTSGRDVSINFLANGKASTLFPQAPKARARIEVTFSSADSLLVSVKDLIIESLADPAMLIKAMLRAYEKGTWRTNYVVVYEIVKPAKTLVLLSKSADTKLLLNASGKFTGHAIADIAGNFSVTYQTQDVVQLVAARQPLFYNAYRVRKPFLRRARVEAYAARRDPAYLQRINLKEVFEQV